MHAEKDTDRVQTDLGAYIDYSQTDTHTARETERETYRERDIQTQHHPRRPYWETGTPPMGLGSAPGV